MADASENVTFSGGEGGRQMRLGHVMNICSVLSYDTHSLDTDVNGLRLTSPLEMSSGLSLLADVQSTSEAILSFKRH